MKSIFLLLLLLGISISAQAQKKNKLINPIPYDSTSNRYAYLEVVPEDTPASHLYENAKKWMFNKYLNENFDLDQKNSKLVREGTFEISTILKTNVGGIPMRTVYQYKVLFNIVLEFKEGRYRYNLTNIRISLILDGENEEQSLEQFASSHEEMGSGKKKMGKFIHQTCEIIHAEFQTLIGELKSNLGAVSESSDDW
jgi:hypothetical protein